MEVTVLRSGERDKYGNRDGAATPTPLSVLAVAPAGSANAPSSSDTDERASDGLKERLAVYCTDTDADVTHLDRIQVGDAIYDVDGEPARWTNPFTGDKPGCVINISRDIG